MIASWMDWVEAAMKAEMPAGVVSRRSRVCQEIVMRRPGAGVIDARGQLN
jgi:hypothetical protein